VDRVRVDVRRDMSGGVVGMAGSRTPVHSRANLLLASQRKRLPLIAISPDHPDVFSNSYHDLLHLAAVRGGFEPRRPRQI